MSGRLARLRLCFVSLLAVIAFAAAAAPLPPPQDQVILTVAGAITETNAQGEARLDRALLDTLPKASLETFTDWTEGRQKFEGVLLKDLLARLGGRGERIVAQALNNYTASIPMSDLQKFPVLLAISRNGEAMPIRDKGPIWIIYPNDSPSLAKASEHNRKMVWQLSRLEIH